jgi:indole-3-glycerol phosphate synthase
MRSWARWNWAVCQAADVTHGSAGNMNCRARSTTHQTATVQAPAAVTAVAATGVFRIRHVENLARGVDGRLVGKRVMFTTHFS